MKSTLETIKEMEKEFDEKWNDEGEFHIGCWECNTSTDKDAVKHFIRSYTRTLLESFGEEIIPTEFKLKGRDEEYIRGFNDGHKYAVGEQRLKVKEIISSLEK